MNLQKASDFFKVTEDEVTAFDVEDTFNKGNTLQGHICRTGDHRYGALLLHEVNHIPCPIQVVWGTPKQGYPFDKELRFKWPPCKKVNIYTKYDGTNIVAYKYTYRGKDYVTYKTRLTPVARSGEKDFVAMWREMLEKYPDIPDLVLKGGHNLSFELYGYRNFHLIVYEEPLEAKLLFLITRSAEPQIVDPEAVAGTKLLKLAEGYECRGLNDLTSFYKKTAADQEAVNIDSGDLGIKGHEGFVFYCHLTDGTVKQLKCKPETVQRIHWAAGGPSKGIIKATCLAALENTDTLTVEFIKELLIEEFDKRVVDTWEDMIAIVIGELKAEIELRQNVLLKYNAILEQGLDIICDKSEVMRTLSSFFSKKEMRHVYWIITNLA